MRNLVYCRVRPQYSMSLFERRPRPHPTSKAQHTVWHDAPWRAVSEAAQPSDHPRTQQSHPGNRGGEGLRPRCRSSAGCSAPQTPSGLRLDAARSARAISTNAVAKAASMEPSWRWGVRMAVHAAATRGAKDVPLRCLASPLEPQPGSCATAWSRPTE